MTEDSGTARPQQQEDVTEQTKEEWPEETRENKPANRDAATEKKKKKKKKQKKHAKAQEPLGLQNKTSARDKFHNVTFSMRGIRKWGGRDETERWMNKHNLKIVSLQETRSTQNIGELENNTHGSSVQEEQEMNTVQEQSQ